MFSKEKKTISYFVSPQKWPETFFREFWSTPDWEIPSYFKINIPEEPNLKEKLIPGFNLKFKSEPYLLSCIAE